jgi:hypothetical protein
VHAKNVVRPEVTLKNATQILSVLALLGILIPAFFFLYRKVNYGKPQLGLHLQTAARAVVWIGAIAAFGFDQIQFGVVLFVGGFIVGLIGLVLQARAKSK